MAHTLIRVCDLQRSDLIATGPQSLGTVAYLSTADACGKLAIVLTDGGRIEAHGADSVAVFHVGA